MNFIETLTDDMVADLRFRLGLPTDLKLGVYNTILGYKRVTAAADISQFLICERYIPIVRNELRRSVFGHIPIANKPFDSISTSQVNHADLYKNAKMYEINRPGFCYIEFT